MNPDPALLDIDHLDSTVLEFLADRIARLGVEGSGAGEYYEIRVRIGCGLISYERPLLEHLRTRPRVFHVGIGFGTLTAALSACGVPCIGFECHPLRVAGALELSALMGSYEIREGLFPDTLKPDEESHAATLLFTNLGAGADGAAQRAMIDTFPRFSSVILDLRLFGEVRDDPDARAQLRAEIESRGFVGRDIPTWPQNFFVDFVPAG